MPACLAAKHLPLQGVRPPCLAAKPFTLEVIMPTCLAAKHSAYSPEELTDIGADFIITTLRIYVRMSAPQ